MEQSPY